MLSWDLKLKVGVSSRRGDVNADKPIARYGLIGMYVAYYEVSKLQIMIFLVPSSSKIRYL